MSLFTQGVGGNGGIGETQGGRTASIQPQSGMSVAVT